MKNQKKVNPYEKKAARKPLRITRKHWIIGASVLAVIAILIGFAAFGPGADPHAGHNHGDETNTNQTHSADDGHDHGNEGNANTNNTAERTGVLTYRAYTNADKTRCVQIVDENNKVLFEKDKIHNGPFEESVSDDVFCLSWATGTGPNDFEAIFWNKKTGQLSTLFWAPRGFNGERVAYPSEDQTTIIVQDIFNKGTFQKTYDLPNAYTGGDDVIVGGTLRADKQSVSVTFLVDDQGNTTQAIIPLNK